MIGRYALVRAAGLQVNCGTRVDWTLVLNLRGICSAGAMAIGG